MGGDFGSWEVRGWGEVSFNVTKRRGGGHNAKPNHTLSCESKTHTGVNSKATLISKQHLQQSRNKLLKIYKKVRKKGSLGQ